MGKRAIAYVDNRPFIDYDADHIAKLIRDIENNYRDLLEDRDIPIKDETGELITTLLAKKAKYNPNQNMYAEEERGIFESFVVYVDPYGYILNEDHISNNNPS